MSGSSRKTMERNGAWSSRSRSGNEAGCGGYRNRLERAAAFSPLMLRSHALVSRIRVEFPTQPNSTKICIRVGVADVINHTKFDNDWSREYKGTYAGSNFALLHKNGLSPITL